MRAQVAFLLVASVGCHSAFVNARELRADANFAKLNQVLSQLSLPVNTSSIAPVTGNTSNGPYEVSFRNGAKCYSFGLKSMNVLGAMKGSRMINSTNFEVFEAGLNIDSFVFECNLPMTLKTKIPLQGNVVRDGNIIIQSPLTAASKINMNIEAFSPDFDTQLPRVVAPAQQTCSQKISLKGVNFKVSGLGTVFFVSLDDTVAKELNGASKASTVVILEDTLCGIVGDLPKQVEGLANSLLSPLNKIVDEALAMPGQPTSAAEVSAAALAAERELEAQLPGTVKLLDLRDSTLVELIISAFADEFDGEVTGDSLFAALAGFLDIQTVAGQNPLLAVLDSFLETQLAASNGAATNMDLLAVAEDLLPALANLSFALPEFGSLSGSLTSLRLTTTPPPAGPVSVDLVSGKSIVLPSVALGKVTLKAGLKVDLAIETTKLLGLNLKYVTAEDFDLVLNLEDLLARASLLLPIDQNAVNALELGPTFRALVACVVNTFAVTPGISASFFKTGELGLKAAAIEDGLVSLAGDLVNNLVTPLFGKVGGNLAAPALLRKFAQDKLKSLVPEGNCPNTANDADSQKDLNLETNQAFLALKALVPTDVEVFLNFAQNFFGFNSDGSGAIDLIAEATEVDADLSKLVSGLPHLAGTVSKFSVSNILPEPDNAVLTLLDVSSATNPLYYPRGVHNELAGFSPARPLVIKMSASLYDATNQAQGSSQLTATFSASSASAVADLFLAYSTFSFESTRLDEVLSGNLDCLIAKLQQGGGLKRLTTALQGVTASVTCDPCTQPALASLVNDINDASKVSDIVNAVSNSVQAKLTSPFTAENWAATVADATAKCAAWRASKVSSSGASLQDAAPTSSSSVFIIAAGVGAALCALAVVGIVVKRRKETVPKMTGGDLQMVNML